MVEFLNGFLGLEFKIEDIEKVNGLPYYMTSKRRFYKLIGNDIEFLLIEVAEMEKYGAKALKKQLVQFEEKINMPVAFLFDGMTLHMRSSLIKNKIPFIDKDKQLYLPFVGIVFHNNFKQKKEVKIEKMMPITQLLFLYMIYNCKDKKILKKDAAEALNVTKTSITRASEQLAAMKLIRQEKIGKEIYMWVCDSGISLYKKAKVYMINPIQREMYIEKNNLKETVLLSGESALSSKTMLNSPRIQCIAVKKDILKKRKLEAVDEQWNQDKDIVKVEFWKYDPILLAKENSVDPISLSMTLESNVDERIEDALEEYMEGYEW